MAQVQRLTAADRDGLVAFYNGVFTRAHGAPEDFAVMFPRLMRPTDEAMGCHFACKDGGAIVASTGIYPISYHVGDTVLRGAGAGNVAVLESHRGQGLMRAVQAAAGDELTSGQYDFAFLHGERWRYRNDQYEMAGTEYHFRFSGSMLRHYGTAMEGLTVSELDPTDTEALEAVRSLYALRCHVEYPGDALGLALRSGPCRVVVVRDAGGAVIACLRLPSPTSFREIVLADKSLLRPVLLAYLESAGVGNVDGTVGGVEEDLALEAMGMASGWETAIPANFRILNFRNVALAFLQQRAKYRKVTGSVSVSSELFGDWELGVDDAGAFVRPFAGTPEYVLPGWEIYDFLFGHVRLRWPPKTRFEAEMLPLPLFCPYIG